MERLLITGVDGPLGCNLALSLAETCDVLGVYGEHAIDMDGVRTAACARNDAARLAELAGQWQPRWILHCGPLAASAWDAPPEERLRTSEPRAVAQLAELADELSARLTVISSDVVFAGPRMFHDETAEPACTSPWARSVLAMEQSLSASRALVVRTHAFGWSAVEARAGFAENVLRNLASGHDAPLDGRRHATPLLATDLARYLLRAYELRLEGLYHIAGAERTSPYRFAHEAASLVGLPMPEKVERQTSDLTVDTRESSLCSKRARRRLEMTMPMLRESLARFVAQQQNGHRRRVRELGPLASAMELAA